jgi:hypothetical protein
MNTILITLLFIGLFGAYIHAQRRKISDGKAMFWATVCEPIAYVMDDPEDYAVSERAANARAKLVDHGNVYLSPETDVWEYVYSADPATPTRDFALWQDLVVQNIRQRREAWRKQKAEWNGAAAKEQFAGQTYTQPSQN